VKLLSFIIILAFSMTAFARPDKLANLHQTDSQIENLALLSFLYELGKTCDCFFTIEEAWQENESSNQVETTMISKEVLNASPQKAMELLQQKIPYFVIVADRYNPKIFHLIDTRLLRQRDYAFENIVKAVNFEGASGDLAKELNKSVPKLQLPSAFDLHEARRLKSDYKVKVTGRLLKVREALCGFSDLTNHGPILWIARTKLGDNEASTLFLYR
jgi:hypothetical protein